MEKVNFIQTCMVECIIGSGLTRLSASQNWTILEGKNPGRLNLKIGKVGNRDAQPTLVNAPFGRAVAELSRNGRRLGHVMLVDSCGVIYIAVYGIFFFFFFYHFYQCYTLINLKCERKTW